MLFPLWFFYYACICDENLQEEAKYFKTLVNKGVLENANLDNERIDVHPLTPERGFSQIKRRPGWLTATSVSVNSEPGIGFPGKTNYLLAFGASIQRNDGSENII